jgi:hypothetical protein
VQHQQDAAALYDSIERLVDAATAHVLHVSIGAVSTAHSGTKPVTYTSVFCLRRKVGSLD